jgi:hypothetical protein
VNTVEIDWTLITYVVIGLFALSGFVRGWWKEAITTFFMGLLILLLRVPESATFVVTQLNQMLLLIWSNLPASFKDYLSTTLGLTSPQIDASSKQTWLVILILLLGLSILLSRLLLPNSLSSARTYYTYAVTPLGSFLGGLLGGLNGFLIINLIKEYMTGSSLPATSQPATEVAAAGGRVIGVASSGVGFQATDLPAFTTLTPLFGWLVVMFGLFMLFLIIRSRVIDSGPAWWHLQADLKKKEDGVFTYVIKG